MYFFIILFKCVYNNTGLLVQDILIQDMSLARSTFISYVNNKKYILPFPAFASFVKNRLNVPPALSEGCPDYKFKINLLQLFY